MKRSGPPKRKTPLERGGPIARKKAIKKANRARKERMRRDPETGFKHTYGPYHLWLKTKPCEVGTKKCKPHPSGAQRSASMPHHLKSVGSGGRDYGNEIPLCWKHHRMIELEGEKYFRKKTGVDPAAAAERWRKEWDRTHPAPPSSTGPGHD